jgi:hypothetical protein
MTSRLMYLLYHRRLIQIYRDETLLKKYDVKANDAILAEEKHMGLYDDLIQNHDAKLIAGGAAQNTARGAQVCIFPQSESPLERDHMFLSNAACVSTSSQRTL